MILGLLGCHSEREEKSEPEIESKTESQFNKTKWNIKEGKDYPYRQQMVNDILYNDTIRSLNKDEIIDLLGKPDRENEGYFYYTIKVTRLLSWTLHTQTLVIKFSDDFTIDWIKLHE
jgi:hypothetical protein